MSKNRIQRYVVNETWRNINHIVRKRSLSLLYREAFTDDELVEAKEILEASWSKVNMETLGSNDERVLLINLDQ